MTEIYLVRHGESEANRKRIYTGQSNFPLTELGITQAEAAGEYLKNKNADIVIASPLDRAYNTGKIIAQKCGVPILTDDGLMEINAGKWEGIEFDSLMTLYPESYNHFWRDDIGRCTPDCGESVTALYRRAVSTFEKIKADNSGKTVILATHATPIRAISAYLSGISATDLRNMPWASNASVTYAAFDENGKLTAFDYGNNGHLGSLVTVLPSNV